MKHVGHIAVSEDSAPVDETFTMSPFMLSSFFKKCKSMSSVFTMEISKGGNVSYMKLSVDSVRFFVKERKTLSTNPIGEIDA